MDSSAAERPTQEQEKQQLEALRNREIVIIEDIEQLHTESLPVWLVAKCLRRSEQGIRESIRRGIIPWGYLMGKATFIIPRRLFLQHHTTGRPVIINADLDVPRYTNRHATMPGARR